MHKSSRWTDTRHGSENSQVTLLNPGKNWGMLGSRGAFHGLQWVCSACDDLFWTFFHSFLCTGSEGGSRLGKSGELAHRYYFTTKAKAVPAHFARISELREGSLYRPSSHSPTCLASAPSSLHSSPSPPPPSLRAPSSPASGPTPTSPSSAKRTTS